MDTNAPQSAGFYNFLGWLETNKRRVALGAGAALVVALAVGIFVWQSGERAIQAEEALASVRMPYSPLEAPAAGTAEALAKIAADYPGSSAAAKALLRAGTVYFGEANYAKAREQFDAYLRNFGATELVKDAVFGIAACLDAENKSAEAINKYKDFLTTYGSDPVADMARFNLVRLYEQSNQPQLALDVLTKMVGTPGPNTPPPGPASQEAQAKIRAIYTKNPTLMPAPVSAAPVMRPAVQQQPLVLKPQDAPAGATPQSPQVIVNPAKPTSGQPNPAGNAPKIIVNPAPAQPAPATPAPAK